MGNHQRIGSVSNAHVGRAFELEAFEYFQRTEGLTLQPNFPLAIGIDEIKKSHRFDLGSENPSVLIECKSHHWTESGGVPIAKLTVWNEAMFYFYLAPDQYRKVLVVLLSEHPRRAESLAQFIFEHMIT